MRGEERTVVNDEKKKLKTNALKGEENLFVLFFSEKVRVYKGRVEGTRITYEMYVKVSKES